MRRECKGGTFTLPMVMETIMTRIKRRLRRMETIITFFRVIIFIQLPLIPLVPQRLCRNMKKADF
jgi:hypothetical protein